MHKLYIFVFRTEWINSGLNIRERELTKRKGFRESAHCVFDF